MQDLITTEDAKAQGLAENEAVLANFAQAILTLAQELDTWGEGPEVGMTHEMLFNRVGNLMEQALRDRARIRKEYKLSLLPPWE